MRVLALDTSKTAGFACFETDKHPSAMRCDVLEFPAKASIEYCADQMGNKIKGLIREFKPEFVIMETALKMSPTGTTATVVSCMLHGAVLATVGNFGIPWGTISAATWRKMFFGKGFQPPQKFNKAKKKNENDWKTAAVEQCEREGITLPSRKTVAHNAAEAAAIAICWRAAEIHAGRYIPAFQAMLQKRNARPEAADLFAGASA